MKRSTIATTALALAASVFAGSAIADAVTVTNVFENFSALSSLNESRNNLTWNTDGADNLSGISNINANAKLYLDTGTNGLVTATIAEAATTNVVAATSAKSASVYATFTAKVAFYPATVAPTINDDNHDLKFALYALVNNNETNLMAYAQNGSGEFSAQDTGIDIVDNAEKDVAVTFTSNNFFKVSVGNVTSQEFRFGNDGQISKVEFQGNGTVDDIAIAYTSQLSNQEPVSIGEGGSATPHALSANEANYLNALVGDKSLAEVEAALKDIEDVATFEKASLLNLDITKDEVDDAIEATTFKITSIKRNGDNVTVSVALDRPAGFVSDYDSGKINGTIALYTSSSPTTGYTKAAVFALGDIRYDSEDMTATKEFTGVTAPFFQVKIED